MSETSAARPVLSQFCQGFGIDIGFGGSAIIPTALTRGQCYYFKISLLDCNLYFPPKNIANEK